MDVSRSASYDGDIILWTIETGMPFMKFNASEDVKPKLISLSWLYKQTVNPPDVTTIRLSRVE